MDSFIKALVDATEDLGSLTLDEFIASSNLRQVLVVEHYGDVKVHASLRRARRFIIGAGVHNYIDIPTIVAFPMSRGGFSQFIKDLQKKLPEGFCGIYIDGVHSLVLDNWCNKHDWKQNPNDQISYYKLIQCRCADVHD